jgi:phosphatidylglycerophosphatase A
MHTSQAKDKIILFIAQGAFSGRFPLAPGTAGTVVGALLYLLLKDLTQPAYGAVLLVAAALGTWSAGRAEAILGRKDAPSIVIDEVAGYLLSLAFLPFAWWTVIAGFFLFRFFDILKPWPLRRLQRISGGAGVMVDDIGAGIYTNIVLQAASFVLVNR